MAFIKKLSFSNWLRYKGTNTLSLRPTIYAVVAEDSENPERSNWLGKTSLLEAIKFAIYGCHRFTSDDEWITKGESTGSVSLEMSDGFKIVRSKKLGSPTQLKVTSLDGKKLSKAAAQAEIADYMSLSRTDYEATCFIGQRQLANFVTARPAQRFSIVKDWLELDDIEECAQEAAAEVTKLSRQLNDNSAKLLGVEREIEFVSEQVGGVESPNELLFKLYESVEMAGLKVEDLESKFKALSEFNDTRKKWWTLENQLSELEDLETEQVELNKSLRKLWTPVDMGEMKAYKSEVEKAVTARTVAKQEYVSAKALAEGKFDGECPVGKCPCPIADELNQRNLVNKTNAKRAKDEFEVADYWCRDRQAKLDHIARKWHQVEDGRKRLDVIAADIESLSHVRKALEGKPESVANVDVDELADELKSAQVAAHEAKRLLEKYLKLTPALRVLKEEQETLSKALGVARAAALLFGRRGAQKAIAKSELAKIEYTSKCLLQSAGIDLPYELSWEQESKSTMSKNCTVCGSAFPKSRSVKTCALCGSPRGNQIADRLDVIFGRSGAAEDLVGASIQLGAAKWLRSKRQSQWDVAVIDEPFGQLDTANRTALARTLTAMVRREKIFQQAFVISHNPDVSDALPGKISIVATGDHSECRTVS